MNLPQENFERALNAGRATLQILEEQPYPQLSNEATQRLEGWAWDLEAIVAALRNELVNRDDTNPVDFG